jgi:hypothetical protein
MRNAANWTARLNELATAAHVPGAALGIWSGGQEILVAHGVLNSATEVSVTPDSLFQVGSITKIWTATMIMQLIDEGRLGWRLSRWGDRTIIGHDGDTIGQSAYLRIDPAAGVAACLLTNATESETLYRDLFNDVFGTLVGVTMPGPPRPVAGWRDPGYGSAVSGMDGASGGADLRQHAGHYERTSRRFDVSVRDGRLAMELSMTGNLAALVRSEPEDLLLYPAESADSSGTRFVLRSHDDEPWTPVSFGQLGDGTPYLYMSGRVAPRVG